MRCVVIPEGASLATQQTFAQILAVHAALLPNGKILMFSGDQHDPGQHHHGVFDQARLFDCQTFAITSPQPAAFIKDLFCCGHAFLADARLLVAGGTQSWIPLGPNDPSHGSHGNFHGIANAYIYDFSTGQWSEVARMLPQRSSATGGGRWYPTLMTLGTGRVMACSGTAGQGDTRVFNDTIEEFAVNPAPAGQWADRGDAPGSFALYPRIHLLRDGSVFFATPINGESIRWNSVTGAWSPVCPGPGEGYDNYHWSSVMLPLLPEFGHRTRVLIAGAPTARFIDLDDAAPQWQPTGPRTLLVNGAPPRRFHINLTLLPTGDVAATGGFINQPVDPGDAVLGIEIYHPLSNTWSTLPSAASTTVPRNYHSVALLMPDGRVWMAGSNIAGNWSFHNIADFPHHLPDTLQQETVDNRDLRIELFEPWYFGRPDRPAISAAPAAATLGTSFNVDTPQGATINRVVALRAGVVTHSFNGDQRYVSLPFTRRPGGLTVTLPDNPNLLPPGPYLLFVLDQTTDPEAGALAGIPSVGRHLLVSLPVQATPPSLTIAINAATYRTGDTMTVVASVQPGSPPAPVDAYITIRLPDGQFMSAQLNGSLVPGQVPIASGITPAPLQQQIVSHTFAGNEPAGTYTWFAVFTTPGTLNFVSALDQHTFQFTP
jgi:hypothetical protein